MITIFSMMNTGHPIFTDLDWLFVVNGILSSFRSVFDFMISPFVLPWVLIGIAISLVGFFVFWSRFFFRT